MADEIPDISPSMRKVYLRLRRWRSSHARRVPIPERLWRAAAELAREHGVFPTAKALHLEYGKLKDRAEALGQEKKVVRKMRSASPRQARPAAAPTFMELVTPRASSAVNAVVELEGPRGRMKIELKSVAPAELVALSRALWDGEA
jgi:hypothetical protein